MTVRITTLSENAATAGVHDLLAEWGFSILMETDAASVLLDTGVTISACHNADTLGIDLAKIDKIVISHSHADHTGGLREVLTRMHKSEIEIIAHPHVWSLRYSRRPGKPDRFPGIPYQRPELECLGARFNLTKEPVRITENMMTTGEIPIVTSFEELTPSNEERVRHEDESWITDKMLDDQGVVIKMEHGLVVVTGCAHRGIINTLYHAQKISGVQTIYAVIGGSHLIDTSEERIEQTLHALKDLNVQKVGLCHCTGMHSISILAHELGDRFFFNNAGTQIELP